MSVLVFTDLHLDKTEIRKLTVINFLDYIINYCKNHPEIKSAINLGDSFHTPTNKNAQFIPVFNKLKELSEIVHLYTIVGNHDTSEKNNDNTLVETFGAFGTFIKNSGTYEVEGLGSADFLSYTQDATDIPNKSNILFGHLEVDGFWFNPRVKIENTNFSKDAFAKYNKVISGHLHHYQADDKFVFVGSPYPTNRGEAGKKNYFAIIDDVYNIKLEEYNNAPDYITIRVEDFNNNIDYTNKIVTVQISKKIENFVKLRDLLLSKGAIDIIPEFIREEIVEDEAEHKINTDEGIVMSATKYIQEIKDDGIDNNILLECFSKILQECKA